MNTKKIILISIILITTLVVATFATFALKPQMHKSIILEQIIFKRSK